MVGNETLVLKRNLFQFMIKKKSTEIYMLSSPPLRIKISHNNLSAAHYCTS